MTGTNVEGDRISSLPDDLIAKILSFIDIKQAIKTSVLSLRWRFIWTKILYLNFSSEDFSTLRKFYNFFTHVKQLTFTCLNKKTITCPLSLFSSQTLKKLAFITSAEHNLIATSSWELPALTSLHLENITLYCDNTDKCVGLFSKCTNLKSLIIIGCDITAFNTFTICHTQLSNITFKDGYSCTSVINVVAPQLKNLSISNWDAKFQISAPDLTSLLYKSRTLKLSVEVDSLPSLEKVDFFISHLSQKTDARKVVDMLQKFNRVKFLTLSLEVIELLSLMVEVIAYEHSPFVNMRSLRILPELDEQLGKKVIMATEVKNYLLDTSPNATFTLVTREDMRAMRDAESAKNLMAELRELIDLEKHEEDKRPQLYTKMPVDMWKRESQVHRYYDLFEEIKQGDTKISDIKSLVQCIEDLLISLPTSNKAELQPRFSSLCAEVDTVVNCINAKSAQNLMAELRVLLDLEKHEEEEDKRSPKMPLDMPKRQSQVHSYWEGLVEEITKTSDIISLVQRIKRHLMELPTPDKAELQSCFSCLCAKADNVITKIVNRMKVECDTKGNGLIFNFHELVEAAQSSY